VVAAPAQVRLYDSRGESPAAPQVPSYCALSLFPLMSRDTTYVAAFVRGDSSDRFWRRLSAPTLVSTEPRCSPHIVPACRRVISGKGIYDKSVWSSRIK